MPILRLFISPDCIRLPSLISLESNSGLQVFLCVVTLRGLSLDHDGGVAALVKLRLARDSSHHVARTQPERGSQRRQCCNEH